MSRLVTTDALMPGDRVDDDYTDWAEVVAVGPVRDGIRVVWRLADGHVEATTYEPTAMFTLIGSGLRLVVTNHRTCGGMGDGPALTSTSPATGRGDSMKGSK